MSATVVVNKGTHAVSLDVPEAGMEAVWEFRTRKRTLHSS